MKTTRLLICLVLLIVCTRGLESREITYHVKLFDKTFVLTPIENQIMIKFGDQVSSQQIEDALSEWGLREIKALNMQHKFGVYLIPASVDLVPSNRRSMGAVWSELTIDRLSITRDSRNTTFPMN